MENDDRNKIILYSTENLFLKNKKIRLTSCFSIDFLDFIETIYNVCGFKAINRYIKKIFEEN